MGLHSNEWCCIAWCVIALHGMAWYGVAWHRGHDVEWYGNGLHCIACMALHYMSWCGIAWHGLLYLSYMNTAAEIHVLGCFLEERLPCYECFANQLQQIHGYRLCPGYLNNEHDAH